MQKQITNNISLKLIALCISFVLWLFVMNTEDPITEKVFTNVPVSVIHPEVVTNQGNTFIISDSTQTISVNVTAKKKTIDRIKLDDIYATADMMNLEFQTQIPIDVTIPGYNGRIISAEAAPKNLQVKIETYKTATFPVVPTTTGTLRDGYVLGNLEADPGKIELSGPETLINSIAKVVATVDVSGLSKDVELDAEMLLLDSAGVQLDASRTDNNLGEDGLSVKVELLQTKIVPVDADITEVYPAFGYQVTGVSVQPDKVKIIGTEKELEKLNAIKIPAKVLADANLKSSKEVSVDLADYIPDWAKIEDEATGLPVVVKVAVEKKGTRTIEYPLNSIKSINVPDNMIVSYNSPGFVEIIISAPTRQAMNSVELQQGDVVIDLINCKTPGTYDLPLSVRLPEGVRLSDNITVRVTLTEKEE